MQKKKKAEHSQSSACIKFLKQSRRMPYNILKKKKCFWSQNEKKVHIVSMTITVSGKTSTLPVSRGT